METDSSSGKGLTAIIVPFSPPLEPSSWGLTLVNMITLSRLYSNTKVPLGIFSTTIAHLSFNIYMFGNEFGNPVLTGELKHLSKLDADRSTKVPLLQHIRLELPSVVSSRAGLPTAMGGKDA